MLRIRKPRFVENPLRRSVFDGPFKFEALITFKKEGWGWSGTAVTCYEHEGKREDFNPETSETCEAKQCQKVALRNKGSTYTARSCTCNPFQKIENSCHSGEYEENPFVACYCDTDLCNGGEGRGTQTNVIFCVLVSALMSFFMYQ
ncbi:hypothetical protein CAPTEDRAFT_215478 [Capitella teleta]|uniref:Protein sleepless n=1 Tax=Capitella teleta TaxID=283909 RepID=R7TZE4_CAPTE|nr:hypothetical protein CAPTEDRAFT_215478 [Capitella teleta]|eukprot:ELT99144.1 hypothetical protein CAPTEDRAFT_215478 [Capitella teleta]